jgi:hypothetical protein
MRVKGQPDGRLTRERRRLAGAAFAPLPLAAAGLVAIVAIADSWRMALLASLSASAVAAVRLRFSARAALGLLLVAALLAIGGWGPGFDRRPAADPSHVGHFHRHAQTRGAKS